MTKTSNETSDIPHISDTGVSSAHAVYRLGRKKCTDTCTFLILNEHEKNKTTFLDNIFLLKMHCFHADIVVSYGAFVLKL